MNPIHYHTFGPEDFVCTLTQAKKLMELGVRQKSLFYYATTQEGDTGLCIDYSYIRSSELAMLEIDTWDGLNNCFFKQVHLKTEGEIIAHYSAFTVTELLSMLREFSAFYPSLTSDATNEKFYWKWIMQNDEITLDGIGDKEAEALADMLITLIQNGLITVGN